MQFLFLLVMASSAFDRGTIFLQSWQGMLLKCMLKGLGDLCPTEEEQRHKAG